MKNAKHTARCYFGGRTTVAAFLRSKDEVKTKLEHVRSERCCLYAQSRTLGTEGGQLTAFWQVVEQQAKGQGSTNPPFSIIGTNKQKIPQPKDRGGRSCLCSSVGFILGTWPAWYFCLSPIGWRAASSYFRQHLLCNVLIDSPVDEFKWQLGDGRLKHKSVALLSSLE